MTSQPAGPDDIADLSYEQARNELIELVATLEGGQVGLEESMQLWRRGEELAAHCSAWLERAEASLREQSAPTANGRRDGGEASTDSSR